VSPPSGLAPALPDLSGIQAAAEIVYRAMPPTPQYRWPLLERRIGCELWTKHENHTPVGAFKVRGGLVYIDELAHSGERVRGVIAATRGNHGQSIAFAASRAGIASTIVVPRGNSPGKNAAMAALGARVVEHGDDFQEALEFSMELAHRDGLSFVPSFHSDLVRGVATCALEFLRAAPELDALYVPIGLGSGVCGALSARDALGARTEIVGVVAAEAPAIARSLEAGYIVEAPATTFADGMACRRPNDGALALLAARALRTVIVDDDEIAEAMRALFADTHNAIEGAGAAGLAAALKDVPARRFARVGVVLTGGNVDAPVFASVLESRRRP
jgi:threonine dehydratase